MLCSSSDTPPLLCDNYNFIIPPHLLSLWMFALLHGYFLPADSALPLESQYLYCAHCQSSPLPPSPAGPKHGAQKGAVNFSLRKKIYKKTQREEKNLSCQPPKNPITKQNKKNAPDDHATPSEKIAPPLFLITSINY